MVNECVDCPKPDYLKCICNKQDFPHSHAKLRYKDVDCNCGERMLLMKKVIENERTKGNRKA